MAFSNIENIKNLSDAEIESTIIELKKDIVNLKLKQSTKQDIKSHLFILKKREIAQLLTIETERINLKS